MGYQVVPREKLIISDHRCGSYGDWQWEGGSAINKIHACEVAPEITDSISCAPMPYLNLGPLGILLGILIKPPW